MTLRFARPGLSGMIVLLAVAAGLGLRLAAARGGLWLDEAWSSVYASEAGTPFGVFVSINHDNNHHLNSLWLQLVGLDAPPLIARAVSILFGTASILIAAAIGARRSAAAAAVAAVLFAVSPLMVNYAAEARGYASMTAALLAAILVVDRWLDDPSAPPPRLTLGALAAFGLLSQLTMVFGLAAITGWVSARLYKAGAWRAALDRTLDLMWPAIASVLLVYTIVFAAAAASALGFRVGSYESFYLAGYVEAVCDLVLNTVGVALPFAWATLLATVIVVLAALRVPALRSRIALHLLTIIGLPAMIAVLQVPNSHYTRYFLIAGIGILLLAADWLGRSIERPGLARAGALVICAALAGASLIRDVRLIANDRADPSAPVRVMRSEVPGGTAILLDNIRSVAVLQVAAAEVGYPLVIRQECPAAPYFMLDDPHARIFPDVVRRCGAEYRAILTRYKYTLSGLDWRLYRRTGEAPRRPTSAR